MPCWVQLSIPYSSCFIDGDVNLIANFKPFNIVQNIPNLLLKQSNLPWFFIGYCICNLSFLTFMFNPSFVFWLASTLWMENGIFKENFTILDFCYFRLQLEFVSVFQKGGNKELWLHCGFGKKIFFISQEDHIYLYRTNVLFRGLLMASIPATKPTDQVFLALFNCWLVFSDFIKEFQIALLICSWK